jgi:prophage regulatory protein
MSTKFKAGRISVPGKRFLRRPLVQAKMGWCSSTLYARIAAGLFPKPIRISARCVGWLEDEVEAAIEAMIQQSRGLKGDA